MSILPTRGVITFVFDDGYERVYKNVLPILDAHSFPGVFALPINGAALERAEHRKAKIVQPVRPWQDWLDIRTRGHEIASHSQTHPDLAAISADQLRLEIDEPANALNATTFVYPGGSFNDVVVAEVARRYKAARTVIRGFESIPPKDPMRLKTFNFSRNNFTVAKANAFALWAYLTNSWLIETYHMIHTDTSEMVHTVHTNEFKQHVDFVSKLPIAVKTINTVIS